MAAPTSYIPAQTVNAIVNECFTHMETVIDNIKTQLNTQVDGFKTGSTAAKNAILNNYRVIPKFDKDGALVSSTQKIQGLCGKDGAEMEVGNLFAKYYSFSVLYNKLDANKDFEVAANTNQSVLMALEPKINDLLATIERVREFDEIKQMEKLNTWINAIQTKCMEAKHQLYEKLSKNYATSAVYPSLEERFSNKEMSYQIEPSGIQGSGRDSRFLFQDFLKSRGLDQEDEE